MSTPAPAASCPAVSVVVPTLNEADNMDALFGAIRGALDGRLAYEVIVVDDASADGTPARARAWADRVPVTVIERTGRPDLAQAVREGARAARAGVVVVMDADGSHPADALPALAAPLLAGTHDVMIGSRYVRGGAMPGWPLVRRVLSRGASLLAWPFTDARDPMAGFFAVRRERLADAPAQAAGYKILLELLAADPTLRVGEVPITFRDRTAGVSKLGLRTQLVYLQRLLALAGARVSGGSAARFGAVGLLGMALDLVVFRAALGLGATLALAHTASFAVAATSNFVLNRQWSFAGAGTDRPAQRYLRFVLVAVLALLLRGGVLAMMVHNVGASPTLALLPAVAAAAAVNYFGAALFVFNGPAVAAHVRVRATALAFIAYLLALRAAYLVPADLILDEMYYWNYAQHMALSFLDHPPLTAWLIGAGTALLGDGGAGVRVGAFGCGLVMLVYAYRYGAAVGGKTQGLVVAMLSLVLPALFAAGFLMTPDAPLLAAGTAATYYLHRALVGGQARAWYGAGIAGGLALLAKYTAVLLAPAALVYLLLDARARVWLRRPQPWAAVGLAALVFSPVLVWNAQHEWASFAFQGSRRLQQSFDFSTHLMALHVLALLGPLGLAALAWGLGGRARGMSGADRRFALVFTAVPLAVFGTFSLFNYPHFHWTALAWAAALPVLAAAADVRLARPRWLERTWQLGLPATALAFALTLHWITLGLPGVPRKDFGVGYLGWTPAAQAVAEIEREVQHATGQRPIVVGLSKWSLASALRYHDPDGMRTNITSRQLLGGTGAMYEWWFHDDSDGHRPVLVVDYKRKRLDSAMVTGALRNEGPIRTRQVYENGAPVITLYYRIASGYDPGRVRSAVLASPRPSPPPKPS